MKRIFFLLTALFMTMTISAQKVIDIWPNGAPNNNGDAQDKAQLTVFLPDEKKATGRAVVVCPGGGYSRLSMEHEGTQWASFFNQQGIALFVLKYRMPHGNYHVPVSDAEEAMKMVRRNAQAWHIDTRQVGIMGFSAGGHLASTLATHSKGDARPDFQILFYPVITMDPSYTHKGSMVSFLGEKPKKNLVLEFSNDLQVSHQTPRAFLALSDDDAAVLPANGANYYIECYRHDVPATMHIYPSGGHGWGYRDSFAFHIEMLLELKAWLASF
ncbi:MAG: alpha/beta hydrolase [Prevotella sp.]|nr:alpha/beta hydrolase [Prevotella sp.]